MCLCLKVVSVLLNKLQQQGPQAADLHTNDKTQFNSCRDNKNDILDVFFFFLKFAYCCLMFTDRKLMHLRAFKCLKDSKKN